MTDTTPPDARRDPERIEGRAAFAAAALELASRAQLAVRLLSFDFDRALYGDEAFVDQIKRLALSNERARIRVLINQPKAAMRSAHRFIELGRRLPSRIEFRELPEDLMIGERGDALIVDHQGLLERSEPGALVARLQRKAPLAARAAAQRFDELWEQSSGCSEFRSLGL